MTYQELKNLRSLKKEIKYYEAKIAELRRDMGALCSPSLSGMPSAPSRLSQPEREVEVLERLVEQYKRRLVILIKQLAAAERYIAQIPDSHTRRVFTLRFIDGYSWLKVAMQIGGGNTADSVRMTVIRYINKYP